MAKDQLVARDFLGLGISSENCVKVGAMQESSKQNFSNTHHSGRFGPFCNQFPSKGETPLSRLQHMSEQTGFQLASAFSAAGMNRMNGFQVTSTDCMTSNVLPTSMGARVGPIGGGYMTNKLSNMEQNGFSTGYRSPSTWPHHEQTREENLKLDTVKPMEETNDLDVQQLSREECRKYQNQKGMRLPSWNKTAALHQVIALKNRRSERQAEFLAAQNANNQQLLPSQTHDLWNSVIHEPNNPALKNNLEHVTEQGRLHPGMQKVFHQQSEDKNKTGLPNSKLSLSRGNLEMSATSPSSNSAGMQSAQLTIFYAGNVLVYDDVPKEKAQAIMLLAGSIVAGAIPNETNSLLIAAATATNNPKTPFVPLNFQNQQMQTQLQTQTQPKVQPQPPQTTITQPATFAADAKPVMSAPPRLCPHKGLPQARKASLARFLEKRKERCIKAPYVLKKECSTSLESSSDCGKPDNIDVSEKCTPSSMTVPNDKHNDSEVHHHASFNPPNANSINNNKEVEMLVT